MSVDQLLVMHSQQKDGRHWLTTLEYPPLQIWPVSNNLCRVGHALATLISSKLSTYADTPSDIELHSADLRDVSSLADRYPDSIATGGRVSIRLVKMRGPSGVSDDETDSESLFVTPQPPSDWAASYDQWIVSVSRKLGIDAPEPAGQEGYERAMKGAADILAQRIPTLRKKFLEGMEGLQLGLKIGISTRSGGIEYVWIRPTSWTNPEVLTAVVESEPSDCDGYVYGQTMSVPCTDLIDYAIGSETSGLVDPGLTHRIAEDYGLVMP